MFSRKRRLMSSRFSRHQSRSMAEMQSCGRMCLIDMVFSVLAGALYVCDDADARARLCGGGSCKPHPLTQPAQLHVLSGYLRTQGNEAGNSKQCTSLGVPGLVHWHRIAQMSELLGCFLASFRGASPHSIALARAGTGQDREFGHHTSIRVRLRAIQGHDVSYRMLPRCIPVS